MRSCFRWFCEVSWFAALIVLAVGAACGSPGPLGGGFFGAGDGARCRAAGEGDPKPVGMRGLRDREWEETGADVRPICRPQPAAAVDAASAASGGEGATGVDAREAAPPVDGAAQADGGASDGGDDAKADGGAVSAGDPGMPA